MTEMIYGYSSYLGHEKEPYAVKLIHTQKRNPIYKIELTLHDVWTITIKERFWLVTAETTV